MKLRHSTQLKGFTIVELLIVVVVIAILAAITIVAYNGIQNRAEISAVTTTLDTYVKSFELFKVENSSYPLANEFGSGYSVCLGTTADYPASGNFPEGACAYWESTSLEGESLAHYALTGEDAEHFNEIMRPYVSSLPSGATSVVHDVVNDEGESYDASYRGVIYHHTRQWAYDEATDTWNEYANAHLHYYLAGQQTCPKGDTYSLDAVTECVVTLGPPDTDTDEGEHGGEG